MEGSMERNIPNYIPPFLWHFWKSASGTDVQTAFASFPPIHVFDVYNNVLSECQPASFVARPVFADFEDLCIYPGAWVALEEAEQMFFELQSSVETILQQVVNLCDAMPRSDESVTSTSVALPPAHMTALTRFFVFLRFRNSERYAELVGELWNDSVVGVCAGPKQVIKRVEGCTRRSKFIAEIYSPLVRQVRSRKILRSFTRFLDPDFSPRMEPAPEVGVRDAFQELVDTYLWKFSLEAELCIGLSDDQEFILPDCCFGILDEGFGWATETRDSQESYDSFFPILPTLALYMIGGLPPVKDDTHSFLHVGHEQSSDIHLRNAMILSVIPHAFAPTSHVSGPKLFFSSLSSLVKSLSSYDEFRCRWLPDQVIDFSALKQRCRQLFLKQSVTKTLIIKGDAPTHVMLFDMTDEVAFVGEHAVAYGAFSDVWKGKWWDRVEKKERVVAVKFLRQVMVQNVKEKLLKRLQAEIRTWHSLCHRNIAPLFGVVDTTTSIGMVSPWCENGIVREYLEKNPEADRMKLILEIASGVAYLHRARPPVVHGDLKGGNILIDAGHRPIITDFGLSRVLPDLAPTLAAAGSSVFAGSIRWMGPELVQTMVDDSEQMVPHVTTHSDVYAFGAVCLEIMTGQLPYPSRRNDAGVVLDILRGVKPSRGAVFSRDLFRNESGSATSQEEDGSTPQEDGMSPQQEALLGILDRCWDAVPYNRPTMEEVLRFLVGLQTDS